MAEVALPFHGQFERYGANRVDVVQNCAQRPEGWLGIYQTRKGTPFSEGEGAGFRWLAPSGATFIRSRVSGKLKNANGIAAQIYATNADGGYRALDADSAHDGVSRDLNVDFSKQPRSQLVVRLACLTKPPCSNRASDVKAFFEVRQLRFWLADTAAPQVKLSGELANRASSLTPHRRTGQITYQAKDAGAGLREAYAEINGSIKPLPAYTCSGISNGVAERTQPCPAEETRTAAFNTAEPPFREGDNTIRICARDFATEGVANLGCSSKIEVLIDNQAPEAPQNLKVGGGNDWRATNDFDLDWLNAGKQATPIVAASYRLYDVETGLSTNEMTVMGENIKALKAVRVPRPGRFLIAVWLRDQAGNEGPAATAELRFDDRRPGQVRLPEDLGWLGAHDLPLHLSVPLPPAAGPSGILGLVHTLEAATLQQSDPPLRSGELGLCSDDSCKNARITPRIAVAGSKNEGESVLDLGRLDEGLYRLDSAAVSGAWLRSTTLKSTSFGVDLTDPQTNLSGLPTGWSRKPVLVRVEAWDGQSGMVEDSESRQPPPVTVIQATNGSGVEQIGDRASLLIADEGVHRLRFWARDLAGNANDGHRLGNGHRHDPPGEAVVRIDRTAPRLRFLNRLTTDPELIRVAVSDALSGVAEGAIYYRPLKPTVRGEGAQFIRLPTAIGSDHLSARLPSEELPPGRYQLRATARDRAGNGADQAAATEGVADLTVSLPLKGTPSVELGIAGSESRRLSLPRGREASVTGRILDPNRHPLAHTRLELIERFEGGSRESRRVSEVVTDAEGRFNRQLPPGPSRKVTVHFPGSTQLARAESDSLQLSWPAWVTMRVSPQISRNGRSVKMRGRVWGPGASMPAMGKLVAIQFFDASRRRWRPVDLLRSDSRGRFRFSYRFRTVTSPQRFTFRAAAPAEAGWPYRPARSARSEVVVYPR